MEENLMKMIEGYEDGIVCSHTSTGQSYDSTSSEQTLQQVPEVKETISDKVEDDDAEDCSAHTLQEPVEVFFQVLSQKFATSAVRVKELSDQNSGRLIGKVRDNGNIICLFPDPTLEVIYGHYRSDGRRPPFTKEILRNALDRENLIIRSGPGRVTHQVRMNGSRLQAWQFDVNDFKTRCGMLDS